MLYFCPPAPEFDPNPLAPSTFTPPPSPPAAA